MTNVKRGTARRLGLSRWTGHVDLSIVDVPGDPPRYVRLVGSRYKTLMCDKSGRRVAGPEVAITAGMVNGCRLPASTAGGGA